jgi:hypothetical protein
MNSGHSHTDPLCFRDVTLGRADARPALRGLRNSGKALFSLPRADDCFISKTAEIYVGMA